MQKYTNLLHCLYGINYFAVAFQKSVFFKDSSFFNLFLNVKIKKFFSVSENQYGEIRDGKVYRKAQEGFPEKEIGEVKDTEETAIAYYEQRYQNLLEKVSRLEEDVHGTANKGSYLMKLLHLKETLSEFDGLGDLVAIRIRLEALELHIQEVITQNRKRNLEIKTALLEEGEQLQQVSNWKEATQFAKDLKMRWIKTGSLETEYQEEYEEKFNNLINGFFERRAAFIEDRNRMVNDRVAQYKDLIGRARVLVETKEKKEAAEGVKALQAEWKNLGQIPAQVRSELWAQLQEVVKPVFSSPRKPEQQQRVLQQRPERPERPRVRQVAERQTPDPDALTAKKKLLEELRALEGYDKQTLMKAQQLQEEFKNKGFAAGPEGESVNNSFFQEFSLMKEKNFLHNLAMAKARDFNSKDKKEQLTVKLRLLRDLLNRDERELQNFRDNLSNLNTGKNRVNKLMDSKLRLQQKKVDIKRLLLRELQAQL